DGVLNFPLTLPMGNSRISFGTANGTVNKVRYARFLGGGGKILALGNLPFRSDSPEVLNAVNSVDSCHSASDGGRIFQISFNNFDTATSQRLRRIAIGISRQSA